MSSIQAYKAHKQEGTIATTTLVSKVHKQGASSNSQASLHQWLHDNIVGYARLQQIEKKLLGCLTCSAATDVGMLGNSKMPLVCAPCLPVLLLL